MGAGEAPGDAAVAARRHRRARRPSSGCGAALEDTLAGAGLSEVNGWVFTAPDFVDRLRLPADDWRRKVVALRNPMSEDMSVLRTTLLGSLLDVAQRNRSRGMRDVRLFEIGAIFIDQQRSGARTPAEERGEPLPEEGNHVGALLTGAMRPASWRESEPPRADFFAVKAVLEAVLDALRVPWHVEPGARAVPAPGAQRAGADRRPSPPAGSASCTRRSRARGTSRTRPRSSSTSA